MFGDTSSKVNTQKQFKIQNVIQNLKCNHCSTKCKDRDKHTWIQIYWTNLPGD